MKYLVSTNVKLCHHKFPRYYSIKNQNNCASLLGFTNKKDAIKFTKYLIENKCTTSKWPTLNMSTATYTSMSNESLKCYLPQFVSNFIHVVEWDDDELNRYLALHHVGLIVAENFEINDLHNINMNLGERKLKYNNESKIRENLENHYVY